jgi:hypothetical protein
MRCSVGTARSAYRQRWLYLHLVRLIADDHLGKTLSAPFTGGRSAGYTGWDGSEHAVSAAWNSYPPSAPLGAMGKA